MEFIQIGKLGKPHGLKGHLKLLMWDQFVGFIPSTVLFVEQKGDTIPFFIASCKISGPHLLVRFEDFNDPNAAYQVANKKIFLRKQDIPANFLEEEVSEFNYLIGLNLKDLKLGNIGTIKDIDDSGLQLMVLVENGEHEYLIPWVDAYMISYNKISRIVELDLPDGLIS